jgi:dipeptidase
MKKKIFYGCLALVLVFAMAVLSVSVRAELLDGNQSGCTAIAVGKAVSTDGSAMITHNDDSSVADFRLWIIPAKDWPEGSTRDIVIHSHDYVDYGVYPPIYPEHPPFGGAEIVGVMPQVPHTYAYFHSRYSFMNEKGVAMGETTMGIDASTDYGREVRQVMIRDSTGLIDCWFAQDIALERAATAREAVRIMGDLVETYGWTNQSAECMDITDGNEVWVAEFYGRDVWVAFKLPDDHVFVSANRARINYVDFNDHENYMYSPNLKSFAIQQGWYIEGDPFKPNEIYCPKKSVYSGRREWRALDLMAPSLGLSPHADPDTYPLSVTPDNKLSVHDIFKIKGDYYEGTEFSLTVGPGETPTSDTQLAGGPWGDPIRGSGFERSIGIHRTCYVHIGQVKGWLPDPIKGISWYGYGHPASTYLTPLWPIMKELPEFYPTGSRAETFRRDSGWWVNTYTQRMAELRWNSAIETIQEFRDPIMADIYQEAASVQEEAASIFYNQKKQYEKHGKVPTQVVKLISDFAYDTSVNWHEDWKEMGDHLLTQHWAVQATRASRFPQWWLDLIKYQPPVP